MSEYTVSDMIGNVLDKNPDQFRTAFNDVIADKIAAAIELRKQEVAQNIFATSEEQEESEEGSEEISTEDENGQDENTETNA